MFNEKYSHGKKFNYDSSKNEFISLKEYTTKFPGVIRVWGLMTYEGKKGMRCALITDGYNVNLPEHLLKDVESIMATPDEVAAINEGKWYFCKYKSDAKKKIYFTKYKSDANLVIYFSKYKSDAGWKNKSKQHLMY